MVNNRARDQATLFYLLCGAGGHIVVAFGVGRTCAMAMARHTFAAPWFVHLHGAWIIAAAVPEIPAFERDAIRQIPPRADNPPLQQNPVKP